jgi:hypothetical protein
MSKSTGDTAMNDKKPEEIFTKTPEPVDVEELEDKELEEVAGGLVSPVLPVDDGNCHNTQCC